MRKEEATSLLIGVFYSHKACKEVLHLGSENDVSRYLDSVKINEISVTVENLDLFIGQEQSRTCILFLTRCLGS